ncbi:MAG: hypothetical protein HC837_12485 [Chloroflexaceae bacterium]|nr:hypothetical protein [Chloroflexaceae bacterium]
MVRYLGQMMKQVAWRAWNIMRPILGWTLILLGIPLVPVPVINGTIMIIAGVALVGRRNRRIRWTSVHFKLFIRRWAAYPHPVIRFPGYLVLRFQRSMSYGYRRFCWHQAERRKARYALQTAMQEHRTSEGESTKEAI